MEKIDRLGWAAGVSFFAYGLRIGVRVDRPEVMEQVLERLPPGWEPGCSPFVNQLFSLRVGNSRRGGRTREYILLYGGLTKLARTMDLDEALDALEGAIQVHIAEWAQNRVIVHAGVVGWRGRAIVLPGFSMAGKSTLVAALLKAGATYYSDEYAVVDGRGMVHPYARRLALRTPDGHGRRRVSPEQLGSEAGVLPLPVGLVAFAAYQPGGVWRPQPLSPGKALMELVGHTLSMEREPEMVLPTLERALRGAVIVRGKRGEAEAVAEDLLRQVEAAPGRAPALVAAA